MPKICTKCSAFIKKRALGGLCTRCSGKSVAFRTNAGSTRWKSKHPTDSENQPNGKRGRSPSDQMAGVATRSRTRLHRLCNVSSNAQHLPAVDFVFSGPSPTDGPASIPSSDAPLHPPSPVLSAMPEPVPAEIPSCQLIESTKESRPKEQVEQLEQLVGMVARISVNGRCSWSLGRPVR